MAALISRLENLLRPRATLAVAAIVSTGALAAAFASEAFLGLEPCPLCIYQRWPYAAAGLLALVSLLLPGKPRRTMAALALCALAFVINSGIAFYHSGVELHWWASAVEGCAVPHFGDGPQSILENIMSAPTGRCDEIPWADPVLGLSMANYNVMLCLGLAALCALSLLRAVRQPAKT